MAAHNELGKSGEELTKEYFTNKGFTILATNWRFRNAEIDLVVKKKLKKQKAIQELKHLNKKK
jgi:putative endonuclease